MKRRVGQVDHPTLHDVARVAGVSLATASRALGGYGSASPRTRARVLEIATQLGYHPNTLARSMITGTTKTIGVVVADIELSFFARAVRGIADAAKADGFEVILANSDEDLTKEQAAVKVLLEKRVDGLIVAPASLQKADHLVEIVERGLPLVLIDRGTSGLASDVVVVDNQRAARIAVDHLTRLGHRRVAIVVERESALSPADMETAQPGPAGAMTSVLREIGWAEALRSAGITPTEDLIRRSAYDRTAARLETAAALAMIDPPTAILTTDETMTLGVLDAIQATDLRIPEDISLVAFDDAVWTTIVRPPLTVILQPVYDLGVVAARRLLDRIAGDDSPPQVKILDTSFVIRGSTAPPRQA